ncbi:MAG: copper chaperone PCu(A)C [Alphaproteobacteria bacterium]|nr:copper chaperone PCu(A)C [Alphaproteobacteria bacterium]
MRKTVLAMMACVWLSASALAQNGAVEVSNAWARGTPGGAQIGAAYLTLQSSSGDRLTGIATSVAQKAELHTMTMDNGVMKMRPLDGVDLPAGQTVSLKPGGIHIMLMGLKAPLQPGQSFPMTLQFAKAGSREVTVAIEKPGAMESRANPGGGTSMPAPTQH